MTDWQGFLSERRLAVLATIAADGGPHMTPVEVVVRGGKPYVWTESASQKGRNVSRDGRVALMSYKNTAGVLVRGTTTLIRAGDPGYDDVARAFLDKYDREETYGNDLIVEINPEHVATWE
ncbi:MAG: pyridoxamine 5'-phosphate oxidase family protein [Actinomycetota bacterium]|nr:pyridoxamine 5'-phosphate oxidase family protein [Actinomycetota bacterium]